MTGQDKQETTAGAVARSSADRPEYVSDDEMAQAAEVFVQSIGWRNGDALAENLRHTTRSSDALKALSHALVADFNAVRQEQIRRAQARP